MRPKMVADKFKQQKHRKNRSSDPRFFSRPKLFKHLQNYSFLYNDETNNTISNLKRRKELEDFFVKKGKKRFFHNNSRKELRELMKKGRKKD